MRLSKFETDRIIVVVSEDGEDTLTCDRVSKIMEQYGDLDIAYYVEKWHDIPVYTLATFIIPESTTDVRKLLIETITDCYNHKNYVYMADVVKSCISYFNEGDLSAPLLREIIRLHNTLTIREKIKIPQDAKKKKKIEENSSIESARIRFLSGARGGRYED